MGAAAGNLNASEGKPQQSWFWQARARAAVLFGTCMRLARSKEASCTWRDRTQTKILLEDLSCYTEQSSSVINKRNNLSGSRAADDPWRRNRPVNVASGRPADRGRGRPCDAHCIELPPFSETIGPTDRPTDRREDRCFLRSRATIPPLLPPRRDGRMS